jgi:hypothetical protein
MIYSRRTTSGRGFVISPAKERKKRKGEETERMAKPFGEKCVGTREKGRI